MTDNIKIIELSRIFDKGIKSQKIYNHNLSDNSEKTLVIDKQVRIREYSSLMSVELAIETTISVALNKPDRICLINKPFKIDGFPYPLFYYNRLDENLDSFLIDNCKLFKDLNLSSNEFLVIYINQISLFANKTRDFVDLIYKLKAISKQLPKVDKTVIDLKGFPKNLKKLVPLTDKWSISDDEIREELIDSLSSKEKTEIITKVEPLILEINAYLDSFKQSSLTEIAQKIGNLAELYQEIKNGLQQRV